MNVREREILRPLADAYMQAATDVKNTEKIALWRALNRSEMQRPMVLLDQMPWNELRQHEELEVRSESPLFRGIEQNLRRQLFRWKYFPGDMVLEPFITVPLAITGVDYGLAAEVATKDAASGSEIQAQHYTNLLQTEEDIEKIKDMNPVHDQEESRRRLAAAEEMFQGILPVRPKGLEFSLGIWDRITMLMGMETVYFDFLDRPEFLHALLERFTQATIAGIEQANQLEIHDDNTLLCHCSHTFDDQLLPAPGEGKGPVSENCWAFGLAQLFTSISPQQFEEFEIPYVSRMAEYFGRIYYGCCDRLDDRLEAVKKIPNLRKVSCSPWSDRDAFAEKIGPRLIMSNKPTPAFLAQAAVDWDGVRRDLVHTRDAARRNQVNLEYILKDISTFTGRLEHLITWENIAMEVAMS